MEPISICMIARNEEKQLDECLKRLAPLHYETILVDTGSSDHTVNIARKYTKSIYRFDWIDDFSAARNFAVDKAAHDWILSIDCDEYLETARLDELETAIAGHPRSLGRITRHNPYQGQDGRQVASEQVARLFRKSLYHFEGIIHEQILPLDGSAPNYFSVPLTFYHEGYLTEASSHSKATRNLNLLLKVLKETGPDPYIYFQLGKSYSALHDTGKACYYYDLGLSMDTDPRLEYVQEMVESYGYCLLELRQYPKALQFQNIYNTFAVRADFVFLMGLIYMNNGLFRDALEQFEKATAIRSCSVEGVNSYSAWYNMGVIYECMGDTGRALSYYKKCGDYDPAVKRIAAVEGTP